MSEMKEKELYQQKLGTVQSKIQQEVSIFFVRFNIFQVDVVNELKSGFNAQESNKEIELLKLKKQQVDSQITHFSELMKTLSLQVEQILFWYQVPHFRARYLEVKTHYLKSNTRAKLNLKRTEKKKKEEDYANLYAFQKILLTLFSIDGRKVDLKRVLGKVPGKFIGF